MARTAAPGLTRTFQYEALPEIHRTNGRAHVWVDHLYPLRDQPGRWAKIARAKSQSRASSLASSLRQGKNTQIPPGVWEFASRTVNVNSHREYVVYARYMGPR